jgi:hypothetical protein
MAVAKNAAVETPFDIEKMMEIYQQDRAADAEWKQKTEAYIRGLHANRDQIVAAADSWVTKDDLMYAGGGAVVGGGVAYVGATQGWWEMSPLSIGIGVGSGAVVGYAASRLLRKQ